MSQTETKLSSQALDLGDSVVVFQVEPSSLHDGACVPMVEGNPELSDAIVRYCRGERDPETLAIVQRYAIPKVKL